MANKPSIQPQEKTAFQRALPHLVALLFFMGLALIYVYPVLQGKVLAQTDVIQARAGAEEARKYYEQTGNLSLWTNSMFGGMPGYLVYNQYPYSIATHIGRFLSRFITTPASLIFLYLAGFYLLLVTLGCSSWLGVLGSIGFAFASYNFINIEAGHLSKVMAVAYAPPIIAAVILAYRGKYLLGGALMALFLSLELFANHIQITYYLALGLLIYVIIELVQAVKQQQIKHFVMASAVLAIASLVAVGTHASRLLSIAEYTQQSIRGASELAQSSGEARSGGLDMEYAFSWSYGKAETLTLLIPNAFGGGSGSGLDTDSETYQTFVDFGVQPAQARQIVSQFGTYWGAQPFTSGPAYAGAIVCFLFVLGLLLVRGPIKWWLAITTVLFILFAWGKNLEWFNGFFFNYFPLFNKFRAVTMTLSVAQVFMAILAVLALNEIVRGKWTKEELKKPLLISAGIVGGLILLIWLFSGMFFDFQGANDSALISQLKQATGSQEFANNVIRSLEEDRQSLLRADALRSLIFILLAFALLWLYIQQTVKEKVLYAGLIVLLLADMFTVNKRYFSSDDFIASRQLDNVFQPSQADLQIMQDPDPHYRVINLTANLMNDARPSFFHKSIGGYHGAKMQRYQDLVEHQISKNNQAVLNMLNTKYFIVPGQNGQPTVQRNPDALGNAWFVEEYRLVEGAQQEMQALDSLNPARTAVIDQRFANQLQGFTIQPDPSATIRLTEYKPDYLKYESKAQSPQLAVFSEIYYNQYDDWKVFIDGQPADHFRANYVLRAMIVPAGTHTIEFRFEPETYYAGRKIDLVSSIILVLGLGAVAFVYYRKK